MIEEVEEEEVEEDFYAICNLDLIFDITSLSDNSVADSYTGQLPIAQYFKEFRKVVRIAYRFKKAS